ncbi:hypothetical protein ES703_92711 [subsurface metagenome]
MSQFKFVNVINPESETKGAVIVPSVLSLVNTFIVTSDEGCVFSTTSKELDVPFSETSIEEPALTVTPGTPPLSTQVKDTSAGSIVPLYAGSAEAVSPSNIINGWLPSATRSSTPVTVTVCGMDQLAFVKVITPESAVNGAVIVPSVLSPVDTFIVTSDVGCVPSTTSKELDVPLSDISIAEPAFTNTLAGPSSSTFVKLTSTGSIVPSYAGSVEAVIPSNIINDWLPSAARSSTPVTVTVCGMSQFPFVKVITPESAANGAVIVPSVLSPVVCRNIYRNIR